jgi:aminoglycoside phosphotransferase (APT) family kinase protein
VKPEDRFPGLREYLVGRFGSEAREAVIEPLAAPTTGGKEGGYGIPHLLRWRDAAGPRVLVLETVRPGPFGHEERPDRARLLLRAYQDYGRIPRHVAAVGIGAFRDTGPAVDLADAGEVFLLTEFAEGETYAVDLDRLAGSGGLEDRDRSRAVALADYLVDLHRAPAVHPTWYRRRLRDLVGSGECIAGVADSYPLPCGFIDARLLHAVEERALAWRYRLRDRGERLRTVHGDFHPWNILFRSDGDFRILDRSRGALGEPADDVASLAINYLLSALRTRAEFTGPFAELFRLFWDRYVEKSGDADLGAVVAPFFAFRALVVANPIWYPGESEELRRTLFRFLFGVLGGEPFAPQRIPELLATPLP